ncbi:MAG: immunity 49 family protein [Bryobacterales bacterium]|nr:immunity 49 family protein [Bryobacterales bacterium]
MRTFPHSPDEAALAAKLAENLDKFPSVKDDAPGKKAASYHEGSKVAAELTALTYALEHPPNEVKSYAVAATRLAGRAAACEEPMDPYTFQRYLALAVWTGDTNLRGSLAGFDRTMFTDERVNADDVVYRCAEAFTALVKKRGQAAAEAAEAGLKRIARGLVSVGVGNAAAPILRMAEAMGKGDLYALRAAVGERGNYHTRHAAGATMKTSPDVLIDLVGVAFIRVAAEDYGLAVDTKSVYLPTGILYA